MSSEIFLNIGSGNGLLPDNTKPLPEPMLTWSVTSNDIHLGVISLEISQPWITKISLKITDMKFPSNSQGPMS